MELSNVRLNARLEKALLDTLKVKSIRYEDSMETIDVWDSMMHMEVMLAIEACFTLRVEPEEIIQLTSVASIQSFLEQKGKI